MQSRYLIPTGEEFRSIAVGILARAKERFPVEIYAFGGLSNHLHLLIGVKEVDHLAGFMHFVNGNLAREANRITGWSEKFWGRRYRAIEISDEEEALVGRLRYLLSHGVKENLVLKCGDWPGLQCIDALTEGKPMEGFWEDRTLSYEARRQGKEIDPDEIFTRYQLELDPLPCWKHLSAEQIQERIREMVKQIDDVSCRRVTCNGRPPIGPEAIRRQNPRDSPNESKKSTAPAVHAASKAIREQMKAAYRRFVEAFRSAAERLSQGELAVEFPPGCFPPPRPFVPTGSGMPPMRAGPGLPLG